MANLCVLNIYCLTDILEANPPPPPKKNPKSLKSLYIKQILFREMNAVKKKK